MGKLDRLDPAVVEAIELVVEQHEQQILELASRVMSDMANDPDWKGQAPSMGFMATFDQELGNRLAGDAL